MYMNDIVEWLLVAFCLAILLGVVGIGLGKVFALMDRVDALEYWFGEVRFELIAQEQAEEVQLLREHMTSVEHDVKTLLDEAFPRSVGGALSDDSEQVA